MSEHEAEDSSRQGRGPVERYTVISADCHGGAQIHEYRPYLERRYLDEFDAWARDYAIPFEDLMGERASCNWDHDRRLRELEADGIVAEVIFPNTIPPFFPKASLVVQPPAPGAGNLEYRWAGLRAHNRWLVDFCARAPGRRAGVAQIMLHDVDEAVKEIHWAKKAGLSGGILLPGAPPGSQLPALYSDVYEPIWSACEELGMPVNHHAGSGAPVMSDEPIDKVIFLLEVTWWAHRALWHLIFGGALERHPDLQLSFVEQGTAWIPETLGALDFTLGRMRSAGGSQEEEWGREVIGNLSLSPSQYWARQCHVGSSFLRPAECVLRHQVGVDKIMWGSDYPHLEASYPFSREALRLTFAGVDPGEVRAMVGANAAAVYGFDLDALAPIAAEVGPSVEEVAVPLDRIPDGAKKCPAFAGVGTAERAAALPRR
jgi:predicted TIM-barrel fold metal-dependent hydrolase